MGSDFSKPADRYVKKKWPRRRKPKYREVGVQTDPVRYSIGVQTDLLDDDSPDYGLPRSSSNNEGARSFGIQADEDESNENAYQPRRYSSAEKGKGVAGDDGGSMSSQYDPIYDSDRSGPSRYRPPLHRDYGDSGYNGYGVPYGGGFYDPSSYNYGSSYDNPNASSYSYGNFFGASNPANYNYGSYYDNPNPSNYNNYDTSYANEGPRPLDDPWNYQPADNDSWGESFARDAANQLFGWVNPYEQGRRY